MSSITLRRDLKTSSLPFIHSFLYAQLCKLRDRVILMYAFIDIQNDLTTAASPKNTRSAYRPRQAFYCSENLLFPDRLAHGLLNLDLQGHGWPMSTHDEHDRSICQRG